MVSVPLLMNVVLKATPLRKTVLPPPEMSLALRRAKADSEGGGPVATKLAPVTVSVVVLEPAGTDDGVTAEMTGARILKGSWLEVALLGCTTVIPAVPMLLSRKLGTIAMSCVELTKVVDNVVGPLPVHCTWLPGIVCSPAVAWSTKLLPFTTMLKSAEPTPEEFGNTDVSFGTSAISSVTSPCTSLPQKSEPKVWKLKTPVCNGVPVIAMPLGFKPGGTPVVVDAWKGAVPPLMKFAL